MKKYGYLILFSIILSLSASAQIEFNDSSDIQFRTGIDMNSNTISGLPSPSSPGDAVRKSYVDAFEGSQGLSSVLEINSTANQTIYMNTNQIVGLPDATASSEPVTLSQLGAEVVNRSGDTLTGNLDMDGNSILNAGYINVEGDINLTRPGDPTLDYRAYEGSDYGAFFRYDSQFGGDTTDNRMVLATEHNGTENLVFTADRDGDWIDLERPFHDSVQIRRPSSGQPVLNYYLQEGDDYGAFVRYDSNFSGDTTDNRLVIGTEHSGNDYEVLSAEREGSWAKIHRDTNISGDLYVDGSLSGVSTGGGNQGLSEVLEQNNVANQSIAFSNGILIEGTEFNGYNAYVESNSGDLSVKGRTVDGGVSGSISIESGDVTTTTPTNDQAGDVLIDTGTSPEIPGRVKLGGNAQEIQLNSTTRLMGNSLQDVSDPSNPQDAATKAYVDSQAGSSASGLSEVLEQNNVANQSIDMSGNNLESVGKAVLSRGEVPGGSLQWNLDSDAGEGWAKLQFDDANGEYAYWTSNRRQNDSFKVQSEVDGNVFSVKDNGRVNVPQGDLDMHQNRIINLEPETESLQWSLNSSDTGEEWGKLQFDDVSGDHVYWTSNRVDNDEFKVYSGAVNDYVFNVKDGGEVKIPNGGLNVTGDATVHGSGGLDVRNGGINVNTGLIDNVGDIKSNYATSQLRTAGTGSAEWVVHDMSTSNDIIRFQEGGNVSIPTGDLYVGGELKGVSTGGSASGLSEVLEQNNTANQSIDFGGAVAVGNNIDYENLQSSAISIGENAGPDIGGRSGIAIGDSSDTDDGVALGNSAKSQALGTIAIGNNAEVQGSGPTGQYGVSLGDSAVSSSEGALALGYNANAPNSYEATFGNLQGEELDVNVTGNTTIHGNADVKGDLNVGGELTGVSTGGGASGLSEVLEQNNTANQTVDMGHNDLTNAGGVELRQPQSGQPVLSYNMREGDNYGAYLEYDSQFGGDTGDNRVVLGTRDSGSNIPALSVERAGGLATVHRNINITNNATIHGSGGLVFDSDNQGIEIGDSSTDAGPFGGTDSMAIGNGAEAAGSNSIALGKGTSTGAGAVALGESASATGADALALGRGANSDGQPEGVAIGNNADVQASGAVAVGANSVSNQEYTVRFGSGSQPYDVDVTGNLTVDGELKGVSTGGSASGLSEVLEVNNTANQSIDFESGVPVQIGNSSTTVSDDDSIAIGKGARSMASGDFSSLAIGAETNASADYSTAIGYDNQVWGFAGTGVGTWADATGFASTAIGQDNLAGADSAVAVGNEAYAMGVSGIAIGRSANTTSRETVALGRGAETRADGAVAIGHLAGSYNPYEATFGNLNGQELDVNVTGNATIHGSQAEIRAGQSGQPVLDYKLQEGDDYGAFVRYDSQFEGDTSDNRLVIGTEHSGNDYEVLSAERSGGLATIHRNMAVNGNLTVNGRVEETNVRDISYSTGHTAWSSGLSSEEVNRFGTTSTESVEVERMDVQLKGGGSNTNFTVEAYDAGSGTVLGSTTAGTPINDVGTTSEGGDLTIRVNNSAGSDVTASITVTGQVVE